MPNKQNLFWISKWNNLIKDACTMYSYIKKRVSQWRKRFRACWQMWHLPKKFMKWWLGMIAWRYLNWFSTKKINSKIPTRITCSYLWYNWDWILKISIWSKEMWTWLTLFLWLMNVKSLFKWDYFKWLHSIFLIAPKM